MADAAPKPPLRTDTIPEVKLGRMASDISYAAAGWTARKGTDIPVRFGYDHGNMLVESKAGKRDLLFTHDGDALRQNACRALWQLSPDISTELIRGYRLARAAGLLGDDQCNEAAALYLCPPAMRGNDALSIEAGKKHMAGLAEILRRENRKPGGIKTS